MSIRSEIQTLENENEEIRIVFQLASSAKNQSIDMHDMSTLMGLMESLDRTNNEADVEQRRIEQLDEEVYD